MKSYKKQTCCILRNDHGIALIIVLLITTLLLALVFEFAYATRVSLRAAANFRDNQRAYYLARSGINAFIKYPEFRNQIPQNQWSVIPMISQGDIEVRIRWEDEEGKLNLRQLSDLDVQGWLAELFSIQGVNQDVLGRIIQRGKFQLLSELHEVMSDEEYGKVSAYLTVYSPGKSVNVNTASQIILRSMGIRDPSLIIVHRDTKQYGAGENIPGVDNIKTPSGQNLSNFLITSSSSTTYKIYSYAMAGGYTKQVETVIKISGATSPSYWRVL